MTCTHSFPTTPPRGTMDQPGDCRTCGTSYQNAKQERTAGRIKLDDLTSDDLDQLYERIATLEHVAAGNKRHVQLIVPDLQRAEAKLDAVAGLIADHEGDEWAAHPATTRLRSVLDGEQHAGTDASRWLHVTICNRDEFTANRAALSLADWINAEFPGHHIVTDAREWDEPAVPDGTDTTEPAPASLRDQIAATLYERERPPRDPHWPDAYAMDREVFEPMADAVLAALAEHLEIGEGQAWCKYCRRAWDSPAHRCESDGEQRVYRIAELRDRWLMAGAPPLGTLINRWWDKRLAELNAALNEQPTGPA